VGPRRDGIAVAVEQHRSSKVEEDATMNTLGIAVGALGTGIPDGMATPVVAIGLSSGDIVAGLLAFAFAAFGVIVVRRLQAPGHSAPKPGPSPDRRHDEFRKAA
jgi:hypothetical protein